MTAVGEGVLLDRLSVRRLRKAGSDERDAESANAGVKYSKRSQEEEEISWTEMASQFAGL